MSQLAVSTLDSSTSSSLKRIFDSFYSSKAEKLDVKFIATPNKNTGSNDTKFLILKILAVDGKILVGVETYRMPAGAILFYQSSPLETKEDALEWVTEEHRRWIEE